MWRIVLLASLWLVWTLTVFADPAKLQITVTETTDGITVKCSEPEFFFDGNSSSQTLEYKDEHSGEYTCLKTDSFSGDETEHKIYVKFRTCDNCIELDVFAVAGIAIGEFVATVLIGVAVYLVVSQARPAPHSSNKKSSDKQHLISNTGPRDTYERLRPRERDEYDVLSNRR